ncbi:unnamed protein product [Ectocarpus sp. 6 AP-2014]
MRQPARLAPPCLSLQADECRPQCILLCALQGSEVFLCMSHCRSSTIYLYTPTTIPCRSCPPPPPPPGREYCCDDRQTRAPSDARCGYRTCPAAAAAAADGECSRRLPVAPPAATGVYVASRLLGYSTLWVVVMVV